MAYKPSLCPLRNVCVLQNHTSWILFAGFLG
jgi:hypothetical protein